jgi:outer membrane protein OmpA-like peptidoglycan-associated protein
MLTLSAGLSLTIGKTGYKRVVDARPYMVQNDWLLQYAESIGSQNQYLTKRAHEDELCIKEYRKILEIEGLLELYKDRLQDVNQEHVKSLYPKNDYSGLNSLRARMANRGWDGNPSTMPNAMQKREKAQSNGNEDIPEGTVFSPDSTMNAYFYAMLNGKEYIGTPVYFFFHLGTDHLTEPNQLLNLEEIARIAKEHDLQVKIVGAADSATGTESINQELSRKRADFIQRILLDKGVDSNRISAVYEGGIDMYSPIEANRNTCVLLSF